MTVDFTERNTIAQSPNPSRAARNIPKRSRGHGNGQLVDTNPLTGERRIVQLESWGEGRAYLVLRANPNVIEIREQYPVGYLNAKGKPATHYFDLLVVLKDGRKVAYAVKPLSRVEKTNLVNELRLVRKAAVPKILDEVRLITDRHFTPARAHNAERLYMLARSFDDHQYREFLMQIKGSDFVGTIGTLLSNLGLGSSGFAMVLRAAFDGHINFDLDHELRMESQISIEEKDHV